MRSAVSALLLCAAGVATAAPVSYTIDPTHTYPSFAADHMGGFSIWRGKFRTSSGKIVLDTEAKTGTVDITVQVDSVDTGSEKLDVHLRAADMLDATQFPTATYKGKLVKFRSGKPTAVEGTFTLHGVTRPLNLTISQFHCGVSPLNKKDTCGAEASATFKRDDYGVDFGKKNLGFNMDVLLSIQVEATKDP